MLDIATTPDAVGSAQSLRREVPMGDGLDGQVALVTGGVRGIGLAICRSLAGGFRETASLETDRVRSRLFQVGGLGRLG